MDIPTPAKKYTAEITGKCSSNYASARRITDADMRPQQAGGQTSRTICYVSLIGNVLGQNGDSGSATNVTKMPLYFQLFVGLGTLLWQLEGCSSSARWLSLS